MLLDFQTAGCLHSQPMANLETTPTQSHVASTRGSFRRIPAMALAICTIALGSRFFLFVHRYAVNVFFWDQWDFLDGFFHNQAGLVRLFLWQHGPHREGIGLIADKYLYAWSHWNERVDSFVIGGCVIAATALALVLKRRVFGSFAVSDIAIPAIFLTLGQYETLIGTPNLAYSGLPLLMIVLYCLSLLQRNVTARYGAVLVLNFLLIYTGFGIFMGVVTVGLFALELYWSFRSRTAVPLALAFAALLIAVISLASFFIRYVWAPAVDCFELPRHRLWLYPWFMSLMFARFLGLKEGIGPPTMVGLVLLLGALAILVAHVAHLVKHGPAPAPLLGAVLLGYSLLFSANAALGRVCLGLPEAARSSRYVTLMIPAFLGIYLYLLSWKASHRNLVFALLVPWLLIAAVPTTHWFADGKRAWAECYKKIGDIHACDSIAKFPIYPRPEATGLQQKLDFLQQHHLNLFANPHAK